MINLKTFLTNISKGISKKAESIATALKPNIIINKTESICEELRDGIAELKIENQRLKQSRTGIIRELKLAQDANLKLEKKVDNLSIVIELMFADSNLPRHKKAQIRNLLK